MSQSSQFKKKYTKKTEKIDILTQKLQSRGLTINNRKTALNALTFIGYFRLRGYFYPYYHKTTERKPKPIEPKTFKAGTTFDDIIALYEFDRQFRLLILEEIQKVEIGLRTALSEHMAEKYGPHWFMNLSILSSDFDYEGFFKRIKDAKEVFIKHYEETYSFPKHPPSWMITEVLTFGTWSKAYSELQSSDQKHIAKKFGVNSIDVMTSWFHSLTHLRNLCAHHNRVWNRDMHVFIPKDTDFLKEHMKQKNTIYSRLCILKYLSDQIDISDNFLGRLQKLFLNAPAIINSKTMGFIDNWEKTALWRPTPVLASQKVRLLLAEKRRGRS
ncbi:Abi family protein [Oceanospirillum linum]|uniref:Abortive phage resistance protein n=1 Tax=Oceanospirillum linum TaxID=966 RepID=A0A1T1HEE0_OCELI|nr:Abi family protein [Oceanospirillum linum]OOV88238.1 hypothetical protein BTA35_0201535 [Oceanospirillum linum]SEF49344.1 Abortive infection bacteriophage resistance protein [Oleiphilus messinensis]SMP03351.1 Abortive infection bacteriophage resistance protein [Oceanospirillum linum]